jgi:hypothetical protein
VSSSEEDRGEWSTLRFGRFTLEKDPWLLIGEEADIHRADLFVMSRFSSP